MAEIQEHVISQVGLQKHRAQLKPAFRMLITGYINSSRQHNLQRTEVVQVRFGIPGEDAAGVFVSLVLNCADLLVVILMVRRRRDDFTNAHLAEARKRG